MGQSPIFIVVIPFFVPEGMLNVKFIMNPVPLTPNEGPRNESIHLESVFLQGALNFLG